MIRYCYYVVLAIITATTHLSASSIISGRVTDRSTGLPLPGISVRLEGQSAEWRTDAGGRFRIDSLSAGAWSLSVTVPGYDPYSEAITLREGEDHAVSVSLSERTYNLNPVTVTAIRDRSLSLDVPPDVDVLPVAAVAPGNLETVGEAIGRLPGLRLKSYGTFSDIATPSIRGSSSDQVLILLDGQRLNTAQAGGVDLNILPLQQVERIEIVKGGTSAMYGSDAIGGVINIISDLNSTSQGFAFNGSVMTGSFGTRSYDASTRYSGNRTSGMLSYRYNTTDGDYTYRSGGRELTRTNADFRSRAFAAGGSWQPGDDPRSGVFSASGRYFSAEGGSPGLTSRKENRDGSALLGYERGQLLFLSSLSCRLELNNAELTYIDPYFPTYSHNIGTGAGIQAGMDLAGWNRVQIGYELRKDIYSGTVLDGHPNRTTNGLYLQDVMNGNVRAVPLHLLLVPAVRWDRFSDFGGRLSPKIGGVISSGTENVAALKINYGRSFRAPVFNDLYWPYERDVYGADTTVYSGNAALAPETAVSLDCGLLFRVPSAGGLALDLTWFRNDCSDLIRWQPVTPNKWMPVNIDEARMQGFEGRCLFVPVPPLRFEVNYTYLNARNTGPGLTDDQRILVYSPEHTYNVIFETRAFGLGFIMDLTSQSRMKGSTGGWMPSVQTMDFAWTYRLPSGPADMDLKFAIKNAENASYQLVEFNPMPGREYRLTLGIGLSQHP